MISAKLGLVFGEEAFREILDGIARKPHVTDSQLTNLVMTLEGANINTVSEFALTPVTRVVALTNNVLSAQTVGNIQEAARLSTRALAL